MLKEDLPRIRENTRPKMISEEELGILFKKFDEELERKKDLPEFDPNLVQHWFKPIVALYFYGGLRKHEAAYDPELSYSGLKGENLIYEDAELSYISLPPTKGRKERQIPIIDELKQELDKYLKMRGKLSPSDYVFIYFGGSTKEKPVRGMRVYREFKRYCKEAGIPTSRTLHGMRHQAVTTWIERGFHTAEASYMAGHSSQKVTEKYTHLTVSRLKDKMCQLSQKKLLIKNSLN
jgi:integrase